MADGRRVTVKGLVGGTACRRFIGGGRVPRLSTASLLLSRTASANSPEYACVPGTVNGTGHERTIPVDIFLVGFTSVAVGTTKGVFTRARAPAPCCVNTSV